MQAKIGDVVLHHGRLHKITETFRRWYEKDGQPVAFNGVVFENTGYAVKANIEELVWNAEDGWWFLPGRVLAKDERTLLNAMVGAWPDSASHLAVRAVLNVGGPLEAQVDRNRLETVIRTKRLVRGLERRTGKPIDGSPIPKGLDTEEKVRAWLATLETEEAFTKRVQTYASDLLAHCEELRAYRTGEATDEPGVEVNHG